LTDPVKVDHSSIDRSSAKPRQIVFASGIGIVILCALFFTEPRHGPKAAHQDPWLSDE
jgi:hypothetical protein